MADVTAAQVKELRERTGAGMMDCRKALDATAGDLDKAAEKLRMDGAAKADKKAGRTAAEGVIAWAENGGAVALVELNSETDFVAKGADFQALAKAAADLALQHTPADVAALAQLKSGAKTLDEIRRELVAKIGENLTLRRFEIVKKAATTAIYVHPGSKIVSVITLAKGDDVLAADLAMHVAASSPRYLDATAVPADFLASERKIVVAQVATEQAEAQAAAEEAGKPFKPKPAEIVAKMIDGKLNKLVTEMTLLGQPFVKNPDESVEKLLKSRGAQVARFVRLQVGEGIEKKETDFAAEVAAAAKG
ncbi:MAG: translation elongation factor Ts [Pseudomonadota bacterium]